MSRFKFSLAFAVLLLAFATPAFADRVYIETAPPAPIVETIPAAPGPEFAWHPGHWRWIDGSHVWVPGHYVRRPRPGAVWIAPVWAQRPNGGYYFTEGHWR